MGVTHVNGLTADVPESVRLPHLLEEEVEGQEEHRRLDCCWVSTWHAMRGVMSLRERSSPHSLCGLCLILDLVHPHVVNL